MAKVKLRVRRMFEFIVLNENFVFMFLFRPSMAGFLSRDWPLVALNARRFCDF